MIYFISAVTFLILLFLIKKFSKTLNLIDKPNFRKKHVGEIPLIGGIVIYLNILIFSIYFDISYHMTIILLTSIE